MMFGVNLLANGNFDDWNSLSSPAIWTQNGSGGTVSRIADGRLQGIASARINVTGAEWRSLIQTPSLGDDFGKKRRFRMRVFYKGTATVLIDLRADVGGAARYLQPNGTWRTSGDHDFVGYYLVNAGAADWTEYVSPIFYGDPNAYEAFQLHLSATGTGYAQFDCALIEEITERNLLLDGRFNDWQTVTTLNLWTKSIVGGTTVNRETGTPHGSRGCAVRIDVDASDNGFGIYQGLTLKPSTYYRASLWYKTTSTATGWFTMSLWIGAVEKWLKADGEFGAADFTNLIQLPASASWARFEITFKTPPVFDNNLAYYVLYKYVGPSMSVYFDDAALEELAAADFDQLADKPIAEKDFLVTIQPREWHQGWTKTPGYTNLYHARFDPMFDLSPHSVAIGEIGPIPDYGQKLIDGGLEIWTSPTNLTNWTELIVGGSTVNRESTIVHGGTYSCRIDIDASNNFGEIYQIFKAKPNTWYRASFWYQTAAGKSCRAFVQIDQGGGVKYLQPDGNFQTFGGVFEYDYSGPLESTSWKEHVFYFKTPVQMDSADILWGMFNDAAASSSIYFDDCSVVGLGAPLTYGPIYRRLDGVQENGVDYTLRASLALTDANAGSYYFWNNTLFVHAFASANPNSSSLYICSRFTIFTASGIGLEGRGKIFDGIFYDPVFNASSVPSVEAGEGDSLSSGGVAVSNVSLQFMNHFRFWDCIFERWIWKNAAVAILFGGEDLPLAEYVLVLAGKIIEEKWAEDRVIFECVDNLDLLKRNVPVNPLFGDNVIEADRGKPIPLCFGYVESIMPLCVDASTPAASVWQIADPAFQTLKDIVKVWDGTTDKTASITKDLTNCKFTFNSYTPTGVVTCDVQGAKISDIPGESSTDMMTNAADILRFFLKKVLKLGDDAIDAASFAAARAEVDAIQLAKYVRYRRNLSSYIDEIEKSVFGNLRQTNEGKFGFDIFTPLFSEDAAIENWEFEAGYQHSSPLAKMYSGVKVLYRPLPIDRPEGSGIGEDDSYLVSEGANVRSQYVENQDAAYKQVVTWLLNAMDAETLRDRIRFLTNVPNVTIDASVRGIRLFNRGPGDVLKITKKNAPGLTRTIENQYFQIIKIIKEFANDAAILILDNFQGAAYFVGSWTDDLAPAWAAATEAQRNSQGFWTDDNGFADPADSNSKNKSLWW